MNGQGLAESSSGEGLYSTYEPGEVSLATTAAGQRITMKMGRQDAHTGDTTQSSFSYIDNILIDWTNHAFPLIPAAGGPPPRKPSRPQNVRTN